jgi:hypothetical protein
MTDKSVGLIVNVNSSFACSDILVPIKSLYLVIMLENKTLAKVKRMFYNSPHGIGYSYAISTYKE